jgi:hypothetical protein
VAQAQAEGGEYATADDAVALAWAARWPGYGQGPAEPPGHGYWAAGDYGSWDNPYA